MKLHGLILAAAIAAVPGVLSAQAPVRIAPDEAMQCAVWASALSEVVEDPASKTALLYALSYFVGHYEGATGKSISEGHDEALVTAVGRNVDGFSGMCQAHMGAYGPRMVEWGSKLNELGERLSAEEAATGADNVTAAK